MKRARRARPTMPLPSGFTGFRFPPEAILLSVRWYLRYGLSYRDLEELLAERGVEVDHVTLYRWVQRFTPLLIEAARPTRHLAGDRWFVDETYVKVNGIWSYVYRAVDEHGQVIDVYVSQCRNIPSARGFFATALSMHGYPGEVITDRAPALANGDRGLNNTGPRSRLSMACDRTTQQSQQFRGEVEAGLLVDHGRTRAAEHVRRNMCGVPPISRCLSTCATSQSRPLSSSQSLATVLAEAFSSPSTRSRSAIRSSVVSSAEVALRVAAMSSV